MGLGQWTPCYESADLSDRRETERILQEAEVDEDKEKRNNVLMTSFNVCNSVLGSGLIAMPFALKEAGFGFGIVLLIIVGLLSGYTLSKIAQTGVANTSSLTYQDTGRAAFGRPAFVIVGLCQIISSITVIISMNIFTGDNLSKLLVRFCDFTGIDELRSHFWGQREFLIAVPNILINIPLSSVRSIGDLSKWSAVSLCVVMLTISMIVIRAFTLDLPPTADAYSFFDRHFISAIGMIAFAFFCHDVCFNLYRSLEKPTDRRWNITVVVSSAICGAVILFIATSGYATFTQNTQGNLFENYCSSDDLANAARFIFLINISLTIPSCAFVTREVIERTFFGASPPYSRFRHISIAVILLSLTYVITLAAECVGTVLSVTGICISVPLVFVFPALFQLKLQPGRVLAKQNIPMFLVLTCGITVLISGCTSIIVDVVQGRGGCSQGHEPGYCRNATNQTSF